MLPKDLNKQTVIVAPLDWGLGHASRCVALMRQLLAQENKLVFAGTDTQIALVSQDFPDIAYEVVGRLGVQLDSRKSTYWQMLLQFRRMRRAVREERTLATELVRKYNASTVISDNRYGFRSALTTNIFLTHQLNPVVPYFRHNVRSVIRKFVSNFDVCWIPDVENDSFCGELLNSKQTIPTHFIGHLCRFQLQDLPIEQDVLGIVSGPEPERSRFQAVLEEALEKAGKTYRIVSPFDSENPKVITNPSSIELERLINQSKVVVSRAGYTTIMELAALKKKAILIPTVGQFEQEYLAKSIKHSSFIFCDEDELIMEIQKVDA